MGRIILGLRPSAIPAENPGRLADNGVTAKNARDGRAPIPRLGGPTGVYSTPYPEQYPVKWFNLAGYCSNRKRRR